MRCSRAGAGTKIKHPIGQCRWALITQIRRGAGHLQSPAYPATSATTIPSNAQTELLALLSGLGVRSSRTGHCASLYDLLGNRSKHLRIPSGETVRRDDDQIDILTLNRVKNGAGHIVIHFDAGGDFDSFGPEGGLRNSKTPFGFLLPLFNDCGLGNGIRKRNTRECRDHVQKKDFGIKLFGQLGCRVKSSMRRRAEVNGNQDFRRDCADRISARTSISPRRTTPVARPFVFRRPSYQADRYIPMRDRQHTSAIPSESQRLTVNRFRAALL